MNNLANCDVLKEGENKEARILNYKSLDCGLDREFKSCNTGIQSTSFFLSNGVFAKTSYIASKFNNFDILCLTLNRIREFK